MVSKQYIYGQNENKHKKYEINEFHHQHLLLFLPIEHIICGEQAICVNYIAQ
jgi:hypothetical protein